MIDIKINDLNIKSVIKAINLAGGLSFLAHPARYRIPFYKLIPEAKMQGIDGIEVWYDYELNEVWNPSLFVCSEIDKLADKCLSVTNKDRKLYYLDKKFRIKKLLYSLVIPVNPM